MDTTIRKCRSHSYYTKVSNASAQDRRLSFKARGLLTYLLSLPENWEICLEHLYTTSDLDGKHAVRTAMDELKRAGYMSLQTMRDAKTQRITHHAWTVYFEPGENPGFTQKPTMLTSGGSQIPIFQNVENPDSGKSDTTKEIRDKGNKETKEGGSFYGGILHLEHGKPADQETVFNRCLSLGLPLEQAEFAKANISPKGQMIPRREISAEDMQKAAQIWRIIGPNGRHHL